MNKMVKGAIATGVGVILLVGGGGTLATWNQAQQANMGSVVSGDLNLAATNGKWTNAAGTVIPDITAYHVVPGDVLTYTQDVTVTLTGDLMQAKLAVTGAGQDGTGATAFGGAATLSPTTLTKGTQILPDTILTPADSGVVKASTTFTFNTSTTGRTATNATYNLGGIGYALVQQAPASANNS
ncbi:MULTISPECIES: alternate-type signal peptide domain-containing protein [unclassified Arthrobacter]|uniref:alternate-type signal peptide domain-containing protein n=1 Tax=unclassified Arthrobacter TaxID=235627 RepID=UPI00159E1996|nr:MULTISPECIES: alternate-type signal peptide domain-containing protein [unclassified Arthrobacter]MCQ9163340.1 alternate-type signal peptide domain-containing protein [Arthrobacter sp. STN4]NVM99936.1 alternate-type signal peptide domain-containing protein [Arthrobacter sp. SDTb3-6]